MTAPCILQTLVELARNQGLILQSAGYRSPDRWVLFDMRRQHAMGFANLAAVRARLETTR